MGIFTRNKRGSKKAGIDSKTGLNRTGLEEYLATIFLEKNGYMINDTTLFVWLQVSLSSPTQVVSFERYYHIGVLT